MQQARASVYANSHGTVYKQFMKYSKINFTPYVRGPRNPTHTTVATPTATRNSDPATTIPAGRIRGYPLRRFPGCSEVTI